MKKAISKSITLNENEWNKLSLLSGNKINKMVQSIVREYLNKNDNKFIYDIFLSLSISTVKKSILKEIEKYQKNLKILLEKQYKGCMISLTVISM